MILAVASTNLYLRHTSSMIFCGMSVTIGRVIPSSPVTCRNGSCGYMACNISAERPYAVGDAPLMSMFIRLFLRASAASCILLLIR